MKVLHIAPSTPYGGLQRLVAQLAGEQVRRGADVEVLSIYSGSSFCDDLARRGIRYNRTRGHSRGVGAALDLKRAIKAAKPTVIHLHGIVLWAMAVAAAVKDQPWISHSHNYPAEGTGKAALNRWLLHRTSDAHIAISDSVARALGLSMRGKAVPLFTVYNGVERVGPPRGGPGTWETLRYGIATRLVDDKGLPQLLQVAAHVFQRQPNAQFAVAGDGPLLGALRREVGARGWKERFLLLGHVADIDGFWRTVDVAVFTAPREAFGLRLVEPMALGIPVVSFRTGYGSDELVTPGETGLQAEWGEVEKLAECCTAITSDRSLWLRLSANAAATAAQKFSIDRMCDEVDRVYQSVVMTHRVGRNRRTRT